MPQPASFVNKFTIMLWPDTARLSFFEELPSEFSGIIATTDHIGIRMTRSDLAELRNLLNKLIPHDVTSAQSPLPYQNAEQGPREETP